MNLEYFGSIRKFVSIVVNELGVELVFHYFGAIIPIERPDEETP